MEPIDHEHSPRLSAPLTEGDHAAGPADSPVALIEYGDYECPRCRDAHAVIKALLKALPGAFRCAFRHFPLSTTRPNALLAAEAAESAGRQGRFWEMHELLFEKQAMLGPDAIVAGAAALKLDMKRFRSAIEDGSVLAKIREDRASGIRGGVNGTPTFFLNGLRYNGAPTYGDLAAAISKGRPRAPRRGGPAAEAVRGAGPRHGRL